MLSTSKGLNNAQYPSRWNLWGASSLLLLHDWTLPRDQGIEEPTLENQGKIHKTVPCVTATALLA